MTRTSLLITAVISFLALSLGSPIIAEWQRTGDLTISRADHTATLLPSGKVLIAGGRDGSTPLSTAELYDPKTGTWELTGSLANARHSHTATLLPCGKVLVAGGYNGFSFLGSAELYDPTTGTWETTSTLHEARAEHTATLLPSGKVLVAAGRKTSSWWDSASGTAEIYDPMTATWNLAGSLLGARFGHTATLTTSGSVLVAGGAYYENWGNIIYYTEWVEVYDPNTDTWSYDFRWPNIARYQHTATLLSSGKLLFSGGDSSPFMPAWELLNPYTMVLEGSGSLLWQESNHTATLRPSGYVLIAGMGSAGQVYDYIAGLWRPTGPFTSDRSHHTATLLPSGKVLVAGGEVGGRTAEIYNPTKSRRLRIASLLTPRSGHTATLLPSGKTLIVGGSDGAEIFDPGTRTWAATGAPAIPRSGHTATLLPSGEVLVAGGSNGICLADAELYDHTTETWVTTGSLNTPRCGPIAALLPSGKVLVAGGTDNDAYLASAEIYDPNTGTWEPTGSLETPRDGHTATVLLSGEVLVAAGRNDSGHLSRVELYDPITGTWETIAALNTPRYQHSATLLPSGQVLIAGGQNSSPLSSTELYDPATRTWTIGAPLNKTRYQHTATLLPSGQIFVAGGHTSASGSTTELYDPATRTWALTTSWFGCDSRYQHTATLLPSGKVLVAGGNDTSDALSNAELYKIGSFPESRRPVIQSISQQTGDNYVLTVTGDFRGYWEASGGNTRNSAVNYPLIQIYELASEQFTFLIPEPLPNFWDDPMTLTLSNLPPTLNPGYHLITVITAGVPSESQLIDLGCSLRITQHPTDQAAAEGSTATFTVESREGRWFQWQKDEIDIPGATGPSYTTPPIKAGDSGTAYRVIVDRGCMSLTSNPAWLTVVEDTPPTADVVSPDGGEYWQLSNRNQTHHEVITWSMSDNIRVCQVEVSLLYSDDDGETYLVAGDAPLAIFGEPGPCPHPGEQTTSLVYTVPTSPPSGTRGSIYKIAVRVIDQAGLTTTAESENPFFIGQPNPDLVRTVILVHFARMQAKMDLPQSELSALETKLYELADHPQVQGLVVDLGTVADLDPLYAAWDVDAESSVVLAPNPDLANNVLFGCHWPFPVGCTEERDGIHDVILSLLHSYSALEYLILVGDDRIIPMARLKDRGWGWLESNYTSADPTNPHAELHPRSTTVAQALAADRYLSDDPLAVLGRVREEQLHAPGEVFIPDLAVGRLVETPQEIIGAIATFYSTGGILDLPAIPLDRGQLLVTGYDFVCDAGKRIRDRWESALGQADTLMCSNWNKDDLLVGLCLHDGAVCLNGHGTHFEAGAPGGGLDSTEIVAADACGVGQLLDLKGQVIFAIGCHAGLPVAGSTEPADHQLDLPQALLSRGLMAFVANSGFGWGLRYGIGYSERLAQILSEELTRGGTVVLGEAFKATKLRYFLESPRFDSYAEKSLMQWTFYGFPMFALETGIGEDAGREWSVFRGRTRRAHERLVREQLGPVVVERQTAEPSAARVALPPYLVQLNLHFDLTAPGVYQKYGASGDPLDGGAGCTDPDGCYYTLNGVVERGTDSGDLPIQPYLIYDSRLSGTSQHGVLWLGGAYDEETGWIPVIAELISNGGDTSDHGPLPRKVWRKPRGPRRRILDIWEDCRPTDTEFSTVVLVTGESVLDADGQYSIQRLYRDVDLEVFYFNNPDDVTENCDREGPELGDGPHHQVSGRTVDWAVTPVDEAGVWRVVVVYNDEAAQRWIPLELTDDGTGTWRGSLWVAGDGPLTYFLQAVDRRGNVSWLEYDGDPESGVPLGIPMPVDVPIATGTADLTLAVTHPDPVLAGAQLTYTVAVTNLGPDDAASVAVSFPVPAGVTYDHACGTGWSCVESACTVTCTRDNVDVGPAPPIGIHTVAPAAGGPLTQTISVSAGNDVDTDNNDATLEILVIDETMTDLVVLKEAGGVPAIPGEMIPYSITVTNSGPNPVFGALVTDVFPPELEAVVWSCLATVGSWCTAEGVGNISDDVDLMPGGALLYLAMARVAAGAVGPIANVATVSVPAAMSDYAPGNNAGAVLTPVAIFADGFETGDTSAWNTHP